ncbi:MAG: hypothetical protein E7439_03765 [Ruminococcaceae bacterium]|nr:hypothetical protein [Oscillospiraceae bacterium]
MTKLKIILICAIAIVLLILAALYFIPKTTPIDLTLDTLKTDMDGNELGSVSITLKGNRKEYLLQEDRLTLTIDDFDHLYDIRPWVTGDGDPPYFSLTQKDGDDYYYICYVANSTITGEDSVFLYVVFRKDLSKWELFPSPSIYIREELKSDPSFKVAYRATVE